MLGKLLKYELKATSQIFLPFYAAILILGILNKLFFAINAFDSPAGWAASIALAIYILVIVATFVMTYVVMIQRFYKSLLGREGYLMHTLPVKPSLHIVCKSLVSLLWTAGSVLATVISVFIMASSREFFQGVISFFQWLARLLEGYAPDTVLGITELVLLLILSPFTSMLMIYAAIALGQFLPNHRLLGAFGAYIVLSTVVQFLTSILTLLFNALKLHIWLSTLQPAAAVHVVLWGLIAGSLILSAAYFCITRYMLTRRLNLE